MALRVWAAFFSFTKDMRFLLVIWVRARVAKRFAIAASLKDIGTEGDLVVVLVVELSVAVVVVVGGPFKPWFELDWMIGIDWILREPKRWWYALFSELISPSGVVAAVVLVVPVERLSLLYSSPLRGSFSEAASRSSHEVSWELTAAFIPGRLRTMEKIAWLWEIISLPPHSSSSEDPEWSNEIAASLLFQLSLLLWSGSPSPCRILPGLQERTPGQQWKRPTNSRHVLLLRDNLVSS